MKRNKKAIVACLVLMSAFIVSSCGDGQKTIETLVSFTPDTYPVVDGSTVTIPLSEAIASELMSLPIEAARQYIIHNKTHQAYLNLISGKADIIFVTSPSEEELLLAKEQNIVFEITPVVSEGFVFLVGKDNPVKGLSLDQIRNIYTGVITNWKEVGGTDLAIITYQRPVNSGSQTGFLDLVMNGQIPTEAPTVQVAAEMGELIDAVAAYTDQPDGIGYSYYYFTSAMWGNEKVRLLEVDGVYPDNETIKSGSYPIRTAYYAVIRSDEPKESPARKMLTWILSEEGQRVAEEAGYVKIK